MLTGDDNIDHLVKVVYSGFSTANLVFATCHLTSFTKYALYSEEAVAWFLPPERTQ